MMAVRSSTVPPRQQLLETASRLFYREGINSVGVDRILKEADVTRATLYRHFAGKEALVVAYLQREDELMRAAFTEGHNRAVSPDHRLELAIEAIAEDAYTRHTGGCPFIRATGEFADPDNPVRRTARTHRAWFRDELRRILAEAGRDDLDNKVATLMMLRDAVLVSGYFDDKDTARQIFTRTARRVAGLP